MTNQIVVGLTGRAGSGKSSLASHLQSQHGFVVIPFAAPLKRMMAALGVPEENLRGSQKEEPLDLLCGQSARRAMQLLGTEWGREMIGLDLWKKAWLQEAKKHERVVADDVRFPNEIHTIRELGGIAIDVRRPGVQLVPAHTSESALDDADADYIIMNESGSLELSLSRVDAVIGSAFGVIQRQHSLFEGAAE